MSVCHDTGAEGGPQRGAAARPRSAGTARLWLSVDEAAEALGQSAWTVRSRLRYGDIKGRKTKGGHWRVLASDVMKATDREVT